MERLLSVSGWTFNARVFNARGFGALKRGMAKFREASKSLPHIVLTDLDRYPCPPALLDDWGGQLNFRRIFFSALPCER